MSQYTTGEMAKLCNITVRTVQFYDTKGLLKPANLSEGGRRLYSEEDLHKLRLICLLKSLGLALNSIKGIMESESPRKLLLLLLDEQERAIGKNIKDKQKQLNVLRVVRQNIQRAESIQVESINDIERMMNSKDKLRKVHAIMLAVGVVMSLITMFTAFLWIGKGYKAPFFAGIPFVFILGILLVWMYHKNTAYICTQCNATFQPSMGRLVFSSHTPKTRKLKCPGCGHTGYCVEVAKKE